jgi:N-acetylneuraminate synthase
MGSKILDRALKNEFVLIAEIGVNYYDIAIKNNITPMEAAKLMILEAKKSGIHAVKFQTYKAEKLASKFSPSYWDTSEEKTTSQYDLFKKFDSFDFEEYKELAEYCYKIDIEFLSTAFDFDSADYLFDLMHVYKISSSDLTNLPFIEFQAKKNKPILLSVGASDLSEIDEALNIIKVNNDKPIILLHCVLEYPTPYEHANLNRIFTLKQKYPDLIIGYSDHTKPDFNSDVLKTAYNLGAIVIEKHFTLDKKLNGNDHYHSMDTEDARNILSGIEFINSLRGSYDVTHLESEFSARRNARRSIVAKVDIKAGVKITKEMLTFKRPGTGFSPSEINYIIGKTTKNDIEEDSILSPDMFI